ncbi:cellulose binding domain-containing protein [Actinoplanes sp. GCM10030250]|uniref:cellulose binding domain-containing protein n=1 Tax=Actinoplanes sp. GCM10030250 TaxID=3273376 RepID=UPI003616CB1D
MSTSPSATRPSGRRLLVAVTVTAAMTLAGLLTVTDAQGSTATPRAGAVPGGAMPGAALPGAALPGAALPGAAVASGSASPSFTMPTPSKSPQPPTAPTGLTATSVTANSVTLSWTASRPGCCGVEGYDVVWSQAFDDVYRLTKVGNVTTVTIPNLSPATQYSFRVSAFDDVGHYSASSETVTVVTPRSDTGDTTPPQAPSGLTVTAETPASADLSWSPSTDNVGVTGYNVYWFDGWFSSRLVATVTGTSYTAALTATRNVFYVRARDAAGNVSIASNTVTVNSTSPTSGPPSSQPPPPPACRVSYENTAQWNRGFVASLTITNTGAVPVSGWTAGFSLAGDQRVTSAWNASYAQDGTAVTLRNVNWNASIAPGASRTVGFQGTWTAPAPAPTAFTLNGLPCTTG